MKNIDFEQVTNKEEFLEMASAHFRGLNPDFVPADDWKECYFETIQNNPELSLRWIVAGGKRSGFVLYGTEPHRFLPRRTGAVYELYVAPEYRRRGIASACAERVLQELRTKAVSKIQLEVVEGNEAAAQLWTKLGFRKVSERLVLAG
jgi:ribosomal protein S18 acetylase RimI-like enzyme